MTPVVGGLAVGLLRLAQHGQSELDEFDAHCQLRVSLGYLQPEPLSVLIDLGKPGSGLG
jgi:hypothetical protein